jgi:hypothetical protein
VAKIRDHRVSWFYAIDVITGCHGLVDTASSS